MGEQYRFGTLELDLTTYELRNQGIPLAVPPKSMDLLIALVRAKGEVVATDQLQVLLWPDTVVTEQSLRQAARRLREALGEHGGAVETVRGRGFRWTLEIEESPTPAATGWLPAECDSFIGRDDDLGMLESVLLQKPERLVTVTGLGGVGKSRLVLHFCHLHRPRWPGGVWVCDLSGAHAAVGIVEVVARQVSVSVGADAIADLGYALKRRGRCLLVLDPFERHVSHAEAIIGRWLQMAPDLQVVVTSRAALRTRGERILPLAPMRTEDAVALFELRARAGNGLKSGAQGQLAALVQRLDGLPLAIELAAARTRVLTVDELIARLHDRFALLCGTDGVSTLRSALGWSWSLLSSDERATLRQLTAFEGGFTVRAAEAVVAINRPVVDVLLDLLDQSWIHRVDTARFDLLGTVRDYVSDQLSPDADAEVRHGRYFAALPQDVGRSEVANLRVACLRACCRGDGEVAGQTALAVWQALAATGPLEVGSALLEEAIAIAEPALLPDLWLAAARARAVQGHTDAAAAHVDALLRQTRGDEVWRARGLLEMAIVRRDEATEDALVEVKLLACRHGLRWQEAGAALILGVIRYSRGDLGPARLDFDRAIALYRTMGNTTSLAVALGNVANIDNDLGRFEVARQTYDEALGISRREGDLESEIGLLPNVMVLENRAGTVHAARRLGVYALDTARRMGSKKEGQILYVLGQLMVSEGQLDQATEIVRALSAWNERGGLFEDQKTELFATLDAARGDTDRALRRLIEAHEARAHRMDPRDLAILLGLWGRVGSDPEPLRASLKIYRRLQDPLGQGASLGELGRIYLARGERDAAQSCIDAASALLVSCGARRALAHVRCTEAELLRLLGRPVRAVAVWAEALALADAVGAGPDSDLARRLHACS